MGNHKVGSLSRHKWGSSNREPAFLYRRDACHRMGVESDAWFCDSIQFSHEKVGLSVTHKEQDMSPDAMTLSDACIQGCQVGHP
jgi:hypothetical protein